MPRQATSIESNHVFHVHSLFRHSHSFPHSVDDNAISIVVVCSLSLCGYCFFVRIRIRRILVGVISCNLKLYYLSLKLPREFSKFSLILFLRIYSMVYYFSSFRV